MEEEIFTMPEFKDVTVIKKANVYFDGKVTSLSDYCCSFVEY